ncbi:MAG: hypothetical protein M1370_02015 [Bacteroidetes bacterium]|nr:hypothetical protein [Bacteroidota bacterium]MCL5026791.1 hypothetical protein [Chloroflexota bacterium]
MYWKPTTLAFLVLFALVALLAAQAGLYPGASVVAAPAWVPPVEFTDVIEFFPSLPLGRQARGDCWTSSNVLPRANAWRCMVGNDIYDPCFSQNANATWVACDVNPLNDGTGAGLQVSLVAPLTPDAWSSDTLYPWYIEMADGAKCYSLGRDSFAVGDDWANYACAGADFILGDPADDGSGVWLANRARLSPDSSAVLRSDWEPVRTVWY